MLIGYVYHDHKEWNMHFQDALLLLLLSYNVARRYVSWYVMNSIYMFMTI